MNSSASAFPNSSRAAIWLAPLRCVVLQPETFIDTVGIDEAGAGRC